MYWSLQFDKRLFTVLTSLLYIKKGNYTKKGERDKNANIYEQPIPIVDEKRREYETILQCIYAKDYIWGPHEIRVLHVFWSR